MKKLSILVVLIIMGLAMVGCKPYDRNPLNEVGGFYEAPHQLRKMFIKDQEMTVKEPGKGYLSGGFFLFIGGVSGDYKEGTEAKYVVTNVRFAWEIKDNTYVITTLPLEKIRIRIVEKVETPTASFFLDEFAVNEAFRSAVNGYTVGEGKKKVERGLGRILKNYYDPHEAISKYLAYVVFTVRSEDWPANINLPVNQGYSK